jgi:hypothetical protein
MEKPYKVFEHGLMWSGTGKVTRHIHWSDGTTTEELVPCTPSLMDIMLQSGIPYTPRELGLEKPKDK